MMQNCLYYDIEVTYVAKVPEAVSTKVIRKSGLQALIINSLQDISRKSLNRQLDVQMFHILNTIYDSLDAVSHPDFSELWADSRAQSDCE